MKAHCHTFYTNMRLRTDGRQSALTFGILLHQFFHRTSGFRLNLEMFDRIYIDLI